MLSSRAKALKRPRWSMLSKRLSPWLSKHRKNRPRPGRFISPAVRIVSPARRLRVPSGTTLEASSSLQTIALKVSRTRAPSSGQRRANSATDSIPRTARPSSLRISKRGPTPTTLRPSLILTAWATIFRLRPADTSRAVLWRLGAGKVGTPKPAYWPFVIFITAGRRCLLTNSRR
ncbi:GSCOCG00010207001-RA-CDS [Cotesia congregata]|nr:GSCOCG00010207001-RA-CDS [Cotesia congregata]